MINLIKYKIIRWIERFPLISILIYNNTNKLKIFLPHEKDYYGILKICKISNLDKYIKSLPEKENTIIGENFQKISGGQAQRISIARSLVKKPKILVLDEGTGQIDRITETYILKNLLKLKITIILITHRIDYLKNFKKIKTFRIYKGLIKETNN